MEPWNWDCGYTDCRPVAQSYDIIPGKYYRAIQVHQSYEAQLFKRSI